MTANRFPSEHAPVITLRGGLSDCADKILTYDEIGH